LKSDNGANIVIADSRSSALIEESKK